GEGSWSWRIQGHLLSSDLRGQWCTEEGSQACLCRPLQPRQRLLLPRSLHLLHRSELRQPSEAR
ncbi:hypothetical protein BAE44_0006773, partial [Dichanthelium oligosanthes]